MSEPTIDDMIAWLNGIVALSWNRIPNKELANIMIMAFCKILNSHRTGTNTHDDSNPL